VPKRLPDGVYDHLVDEALRTLVREAERERVVDVGDLDPARTPSFLAAHVRPLLERVLESVRGEDDDDRQRRRVEILNRVLGTLADAAKDHCGELPIDPDATAVAGARHLRAVRTPAPLGGAPPLLLPETPLAESALLVNAAGEPSLGHELARELASADRVDLLCAFVRWTGLRFVIDELRDLVARSRRRGDLGPALRVLTTTYVGASDARAIEELARLGAEVRISYDTGRTRLHAKAWLFHRGSGTHTAYIGSSNLSRAALHDGLEWNVRLSQRDAGPLLEKFRSAFESYWDSAEFVPFDATRDGARVRAALAAARRGFARGGAPGDSDGATPAADWTRWFELRPHPYQEPMLEALRAERERGHLRNLVVAPTGTGKTLVAAFDYARLRKELPRDRLLFVAHRERILSQSRAAFAAVLREPEFGELLTGGERPTRGDHVFATVQSLARLDLARDLPPDRFDVVIVDEFHHAEAPTYDRLLAHVRPQVLVGLTATPERHDGKDVRRWFDGRTAYDLRLWDALEQGLLAPFQYFGVKDAVDLTAVSWKRGFGYDRDELSSLYTGADARVRLVLQEIHRRVAEPRRMRALGFCVSVAHAEYMARKFTEAGLASAAVVGDTPGDARNLAIARLEKGELQALFTVDLFNEGVDIPTVDTILFLRPTESAAVFLQQLGRGLRRHEEKPCLTVLDFIGNARREFRFDRRFKALLGGTTRQVREQIEQEFPYLPPGCAMQLDPLARRAVLENIKASIGAGVQWLSSELHACGFGTGLRDFLRDVGVSPIELYANDRSFTSLQEHAFGTPVLSESQRELHARLRAILHVTDDERLSFLRQVAGTTLGPTRSIPSGGEDQGEGPLPPLAAATPREQRLAAMLAAALLDCRRPDDALAELERARASPAFRSELAQVIDVLYDDRREVTSAWQSLRPVPLHVHTRYRQEEVLAALGAGNGAIPRLQAGVFYVEPENVDLLFVTLRKSESGFSPSTMYRDYAMSPTRFHWESQNTAHPGSPTGRRYLEKNSTVLLFVREHRKQPNGVAEPYWFLGPASLESASGERPMQIVWRLEHAMPGHLFQRATLVAG
jgi:superfamily II DNA or RNA helicase/HKD family nuclease